MGWSDVLGRAWGRTTSAELAGWMVFSAELKGGATSLAEQRGRLTASLEQACRAASSIEQRGRVTMPLPKSGGRVATSSSESGGRATVSSPECGGRTAKSSVEPTGWVMLSAELVGNDVFNGAMRQALICFCSAVSLSAELLKQKHPLTARHGYKVKAIILQWGCQCLWS